MTLLFLNFANIMPDDFFYGLKLFSEDIEVIMADNLEQKESIIEKHQKIRVDEEFMLKSQNKKIPDVLIEAKEKGLIEYEKIQIKKIIVDFNQCLTIENAMKETECINGINSRANSLKITSENCPNGVDAFVIRVASDKFQELQKQCPGISSWDYIDASQFYYN